MRGLKGFTLVESVIVIVLIGIVGVVVIPRFLRPNAFSPVATQDGLIATIRAAQQAALGRSAVTFEIDTDGDDWTFTAKAGIDTIRTFAIPTNGVTLETGLAVMSGDTCASDPGDFNDAMTSDFLLTFDGKGNLLSFTNGAPPELVSDVSFNGVRICVNDDVELSVCVSPAGYAYAGNCDE